MSKSTSSLHHPKKTLGDRFLSGLNKFWTKNRSTIYTSLGVLVLVVVAALVLRQRHEAKELAAKDAFSLAMARHLSDSASLSQSLQEVTKSYKGTDFSGYAAYLLAQQQLSGLHYAEALTWFDLAIADKKSGDFVYAEAFEGKGVALEGLGKTTEAMEAYQKVLSLKEGSHRYPQVNFKLALLALNNDKKDLARTYFKAILNDTLSPADLKAIAEKESNLL